MLRLQRLWYSFSFSSTTVERKGSARDDSNGAPRSICSISYQLALRATSVDKSEQHSASARGELSSITPALRFLSLQRLLKKKARSLITLPAGEQPVTKKRIRRSSKVPKQRRLQRLHPTT